jgi:hypothetical protein
VSVEEEGVVVVGVGVGVSVEEVVEREGGC